MRSYPNLGAINRVVPGDGAIQWQGDHREPVLPGGSILSSRDRLRHKFLPAVHHDLALSCSEPGHLNWQRIVLMAHCCISSILSQICCDGWLLHLGCRRRPPARWRTLLWQQRGRARKFVPRLLLPRILNFMQGMLKIAPMSATRCSYLRWHCGRYRRICLSLSVYTCDRSSCSLGLCQASG